MKARDLMTPHAQAVTPADPMSHAAALMRDSNVGFLAVVEDRDSRQLVGVSPTGTLPFDTSPTRTATSAESGNI